MTSSQSQRPDLHGFPLVLLLGERKVVVIGAGKIASRKIDGLIAGGAKNITVIAPEATEHVQQLARTNALDWHQREFQENDIEDAFFVMTATENAAVNRAVFLAGEARNIFVNSADDPVNCSSILMSTVRQGDVTIAISTAGKSPAFAKWIRKYLQGRLGPEYGILISLVNDERERIRSLGFSSEDINWDPAFDFSVVQMVRDDKLEEVREFIAQFVREEIKATEASSATLVATDQ
ncbi:MAG TPA: bifunctional precorrin-2 dehydrogenase/sirohydrochlorin ferrochelatase [Acidimicrobiia bacterium]|nr:bifunctional precorrin-2 dehydrogenase/sirohydrochlorin ferrochelatase [Acidimicrobiia bacterium]